MNNFEILRPIVKLIWDSENLDSSRCERQRVVGHIEHQPEEHHWDCRNKTTGEKQLTLSSLVFSVFDEYKFCVLLPFLQISLETTLRFFWFDMRLKPRPESMKVFCFYHLKSPIFSIKKVVLFIPTTTTLIPEDFLRGRNHLWLLLLLFYFNSCFKVFKAHLGLRVTEKNLATFREKTHLGVMLICILVWPALSGCLIYSSTRFQQQYSILWRESKSRWKYKKQLKCPFRP